MARGQLDFGMDTLRVRSLELNGSALVRLEGQTGDPAELRVVKDVHGNNMLIFWHLESAREQFVVEFTKLLGVEDLVLVFLVLEVQLNERDAFVETARYFEEFHVA